MYEYNRFRNDRKIEEGLASCRRKCKCGHSTSVPYSSKREYVICSWCGGRVYHDIKKQKQYDEKCYKENFKYNLNKMLKIVNDTKKKKQKLRRKTFKKNDEYFKYCNKVNINVYLVNFDDDKKNIVVYYDSDKNLNKRKDDKKHEKRNRNKK